MKLQINTKNPQKDKIEGAIEALKEGKIIIYPTDTVYGIGASVFNIEAIKKVYSMKKRSLNKPLSICVSNIEDIYKIAYLDRDTEEKLNDIFPGPFTVILKKKEILPSILSAGSSKIGIRIPDSKVCIELSREFPITTTSANLSGEKIPESIEEILKQLGNNIDLILDAGIYRHGIHSTVIDMTVSPPKILRKGVKMPVFK